MFKKPKVILVIITIEARKPTQMNAYIIVVINSIKRSTFKNNPMAAKVNKNILIL